RRPGEQSERASQLRLLVFPRRPFGGVIPVAEVVLGRRQAALRGPPQPRHRGLRALRRPRPFLQATGHEPLRDRLPSFRRRLPRPDPVRPLALEVGATAPLRPPLLQGVLHVLLKLRWALFGALYLGQCPLPLLLFLLASGGLLPLAASLL